MWTPPRTPVKRLSAADTRCASPRETRKLCASTARNLNTGECVELPNDTPKILCPKIKSTLASSQSAGAALGCDQKIKRLPAADRRVNAFGRHGGGRWISTAVGASAWLSEVFACPLSCRLKQPALRSPDGNCQPCPISSAGPVCGSDGRSYASKVHTEQMHTREAGA